jgi:hypothetical protein
MKERLNLTYKQCDFVFNKAAHEIIRIAQNMASFERSYKPRCTEIFMFRLSVSLLVDTVHHKEL